MPPAPPPWTEHPHTPTVGQVLAQLDALPDGTVQLLDLGPPEQPFRLLLLRSGGSVCAYLNRCPHFGVPLARQQDQVIFQAHQSLSCNVHYARFRWHDGWCEQGDCESESLTRVAVCVTPDGSVRFAGWQDGQ
jgi:nitrite reductase/ring-hydroxylating ferredoxin subunit